MASGVGWSAFVSIGCFVAVLSRIKRHASWDGAGLACFAVVASQHRFGLPVGGSNNGVHQYINSVEFFFKGDG